MKPAREQMDYQNQKIKQKQVREQMLYKNQRQKKINKEEKKILLKIVMEKTEGNGRNQKDN